MGNNGGDVKKRIAVKSKERTWIYCVPGHKVYLDMDHNGIVFEIHLLDNGVIEIESD
jgi:hypothetical protein